MKYARYVIVKDIDIDEKYLDIPSQQLIGLLSLRYDIKSYSMLGRALGMTHSAVSRAITKTTGVVRDGGRKSRIAYIIEDE